MRYALGISRSVVAAAAVVLLCALAAASPAYAVDTIGCENVWQGPSADNDVMKCVLDKKRIQNKASTLVLPILSFILLVIIVLVLPWFMCLSCLDRWLTPPTPTAMLRARLWLFMWMLFALLWSCGVFALTVIGTTSLIKSVHTIGDSLVDMTNTYLVPTANNIRQLLSDPNKYAPSTITFNVDDMTSAVTNFNTSINDATTPMYYYSMVAQIVLIVISGVLLFACFALLIAGCCRCARIMPNVFGCTFWLLGIVFALLAIVFTFVMPLTGQVCNELKQHRDRAPGAIQWYGVPACKKSLDSDKLHGTIRTETSNAASSACEQIMKYCDLTKTYDTSKPDIAFVCGKELSDKQQCTSLSYFSDVVKDTSIKDDLRSTVCRNDRPASEWNCTLPTCANYCNDFAQAEITPAKWSTELMNMISYIDNVTIAVRLANEFLDCNYLIDLVTGPLLGVETNPTRGDFGAPMPEVCAEFATSSIVMASGCFVGIFTCIIAFCISQRGRNVWCTTRTLK